MFTARKVFSSSLVISAASSEATGCTEWAERPISAAAASRQSGGHSADDPRDVLVGEAVVAGIDALGAEGDEDVAPGA